MLTKVDTLKGLRKGKTSSRDPDPIEPVAKANVEAVVPHLSPTFPQWLSSNCSLGAGLEKSLRWLKHPADQYATLGEIVEEFGDTFRCHLPITAVVYPDRCNWSEQMTHRSKRPVGRRNDPQSIEVQEPRLTSGSSATAKRCSRAWLWLALSPFETILVALAESTLVSAVLKAAGDLEVTPLVVIFAAIRQATTEAVGVALSEVLAVSPWGGTVTSLRDALSRGRERYGLLRASLDGR